MQRGPVAVALLTPVHAATGCGGFHRRSPTGGAANGMPLKLRTPFDIAPETSPPSIFTVSSAANSHSVQLAASPADRRIRVRRMVNPRLRTPPACEPCEPREPREPCEPREPVLIAASTIAPPS